MERVSKVAMIFIKLGVSIAMLGYLLTHFDFADALERIQSLPLVSIVLILFVFLLQLIASSFRYSLTLEVMGLKVPYSVSLSSVFIGYFFSQTMISFVGGDAMRTVHTSRTGEKISQITKAVVVDRVSGFAGQIALLGCTLPFLLPLLPEVHLQLALTGIVLISIALLFSLAWLGDEARLTNASGFTALLRNYARRVLDRLLTLRAIFSFLGLSFVISLLNCLAYYAIAKVLGIPLDLADALILTPPAFFLSMLPISISGWGIREGATVMMLGIAGMASADALCISIFFGLSLLVISLPGGILWLVSPKHIKTEEIPEPPLP